MSYSGVALGNTLHCFLHPYSVTFCHIQNIFASPVRIYKSQTRRFIYGGSQSSQGKQREPHNLCEFSVNAETIETIVQATADSATLGYSILVAVAEALESPSFSRW